MVEREADLCATVPHCPLHSQPPTVSLVQCRLTPRLLDSLATSCIHSAHRSILLTCHRGGIILDGWRLHLCSPSFSRSWPQAFSRATAVRPKCCAALDEWAMERRKAGQLSVGESTTTLSSAASDVSRVTPLTAQSSSCPVFPPACLLTTRHKRRHSMSRSVVALHGRDRSI